MKRQREGPPAARWRRLVVHLDPRFLHPQHPHQPRPGQVLADVETDPDDLTRLRLISALREVLG